ncbi:hypothetical protein ACFQH2_00535 [Natronoarchaeum sp. GCM10025703]|uniref:hypothetical protein n=1 Tax=Natronoarchaeum sp. GCM10025703 TaxID=3252685 RepID=UPI0036064B41
MDSTSASTSGTAERAVPSPSDRRRESSASSHAALIRSAASPKRARSSGSIAWSYSESVAWSVTNERAVTSVSVVGSATASSVP